MFCYGSCSLAQTLIDRLVDQRRDHPRGERGRERGDIRENSRDLFATSDENEIENKTWNLRDYFSYAREERILESY